MNKKKKQNKRLKRAVCIHNLRGIYEIRENTSEVSCLDLYTTTR